MQVVWSCVSSKSSKSSKSSILSKSSNSSKSSKYSKLSKSSNQVDQVDQIHRWCHYKMQFFELIAVFYNEYVSKDYIIGGISLCIFILH